MKVRIGIAALALALTVTFVAPLDGARHFALDTSTPEAGSTVPAPSEISLTFTQEPQEGTVQIRVVEAEEAGVHVMGALQDAEDPLTFSIVLHGTLAPATYTVSWRGMGQDGHVVRDTFEFVVAAP